jgi:hypothetical protein
MYGGFEKLHVPLVIQKVRYTEMAYKQLPYDYPPTAADCIYDRTMSLVSMYISASVQNMLREDLVASVVAYFGCYQLQRGSSHPGSRALLVTSAGTPAKEFSDACSPSET